MPNVVFRRIAEQEMREAYNWYEEKRVGLGEEFLLCIEAAIERIRRNPTLYPELHENVRRALIRRFPYGLFYINENDRIVVVAVFH